MAVKASIRNQIKRGFAFSVMLVLLCIALETIRVFAPTIEDYMRWQWRYLQSPQLDLDIAQDRIIKYFGISDFQLNDYILEEQKSESNFSFHSLHECNEFRTFILKPKQMKTKDDGKFTLASVLIVRRLRTTAVTLFIIEPGKPRLHQIGEVQTGDPTFCPQYPLTSAEVKTISRISKLADDPSFKIVEKNEFTNVTSSTTKNEFTKPTPKNQRYRDSIEGLRLIQPTATNYRAHPDPILEAAFLFDLEKFKTLVIEAGLKQGSPKYLKKMSAALRQVAPAVKWYPTEQVVHRDSKTPEPPPRKNDGKEFLNYLIQQKADPNDSSNTQPSILFLSQDIEVEKILKQAGARLTDPELLLIAIEDQDLVQIKKLLDKPDYKPYGSQSRLPTPLRSAVYRLPSEINETTELSQNPLTEYKIVHLLITHPSKKIDLRERVVYADTVFWYVLKNRMHSVAAEYFARNIKAETPTEAEALFPYYMSTKKGTKGFEISAQLQNKIKMDLIKNKSNLSGSYYVVKQYFLNAIGESDVETVELLIKLGAVPSHDAFILPRYLNFLKSVQLTDIHRKIIRILIKNGAYLNEHSIESHYFKSHYGKLSPLNYFIMNTEHDLIQFALNSGASSTYAARGVCTPLATAVTKNDLKVASLLLKYKANPQALTVADRCNELEFPGRDLTEMKIIDMPMSSEMKKLLSKK